MPIYDACLRMHQPRSSAAWSLYSLLLETSLDASEFGGVANCTIISNNTDIYTRFPAVLP